jgi:hypothetical protein
MKNYAPLFLLLLFTSCVNRNYSKKDIEGIWKLEKSGADNGFTPDYIIFNNDSVKLYHRECYIIDIGTYTLNEDELQVQVDESQFQYSIEMVNKTIQLISLDAKGNKNHVYTNQNHDFNFDIPSIFNPKCFEGFEWIYTGRKEILIGESGLNNDTIITPPLKINLKRNENIEFSWDKWILRHAIPDSKLDFLILDYNGYEITIVPYSWHPNYKEITDTAYVYKRIRN